MFTLTVLLGTRPEAIKLAPVIYAAQKKGHQVKTIFTGQHREMVYPLLKYFEIEPDLELDVMTHNQDLSQLSERIIKKLNLHQDDLIHSNAFIVQGDTTTAFVAAYWGFCHHIPVAHVEAGLRTYDLESPFPEEGNRELIARIATLHFAPTMQAAMTLRSENLPYPYIYLVGNTSIDAIHFVLDKTQHHCLSDIQEIPKEVIQFIGHSPYLIVTAHRRESFGPGLEGICQGILKVIEARKDVRVIYPVHPNPNVRSTVQKKLGSHPQIHLCEPLSYVGFVSLLKNCSVILTDSGGIQEEGPSLRKPIIVLREKTERPEGVTAGFSQLVGTDPDRILTATLNALNQGLLTDAINPYGDGQSAQKIIQKLEEHLLLSNSISSSAAAPLWQWTQKGGGYG